MQYYETNSTIHYLFELKVISITNDVVVTNKRMPYNNYTKFQLTARLFYFYQQLLLQGNIKYTYFSDFFTSFTRVLIL